MFRRLVNVQRRSAHSHSSHGNTGTPTLFNEPALAPGQKRQFEDWEMLWYVGMFGASMLTAIGLMNRPDTTLSTWAKDEALVRELRADEGEEIELGKNYSQIRFGNMWTKAVGQRPVRGDQDVE